MSASRIPAVEVLLRKAASDEAILSLDLVSDSILGFHAQQAAEKLMKALLTQLQVHFERTHNLERLQILLASNGEILPQTVITLGDLTDFGVDYRYDLLMPASAFDRTELSTTICMLREHVTGRIAALSAQP
jgi:hypothetical protein